MKVLVTDVIAGKALDLLNEKHDVDVKDVTHDELMSIIPEYDALIVRSKTKVPKEVLDKGSKLKIVAMAGIGVDHIDVEYARKKNVVVVNAPTGSTYSVAELAIGLMIALARHIPKADVSMKAGRWEKKKLLGAELRNKTLGIIGLGRIGKQVALSAKPFGMDMIAYDPYVTQETMMKYEARKVELDELLTNSDFISIHADLNDETRGMMNMEKLKKMKPSAFILNDARGKIIVQKDLIEALKTGVIAGAALDVYEKEPPKDSPILKLDNVVLTPHIGASTAEGQVRAGVIVAEDVIRVLDGKEAENAIPEIPYYIEAFKAQKTQ